MRLRSRYTATILAMLTAIMLVGGSGMFAQFRDAVQTVQESSERIVWSTLYQQLENRGRVTAELIAAAVANALYIDDVDVIRDIARPTLAQADIDYVFVIDRDDVIIHDGTETLERFGNKVEDHHHQEMRRQVATITWISAGVMHIATPVQIGNEFLGAVRIGVPLASIADDIQFVTESYEAARSESVRDMLLKFGIVAAILVLFGVILSTVVAGKLSQPILALSEATKKIGRGEYLVDVATDQTDELGELAGSFQSMADTLKDTTVSRAYLDSILNSMLDPLLVVDELGSIRMVNPAACKILGADRSKLVGQDVDKFLTVMGNNGDGDGGGTQADSSGAQADGSYRAIDGCVRRASGHVTPVLVSRATLSSGHVITLRDITDRLRFEETLRRAKDEAEAASQTKSRFLAVMSHELRTPLNAIIGFSEVIKDQLLGQDADARYRAYAADIFSSGQHLLELINDILDLSKVEAGQMELKQGDIDVRASVDQVVTLCTGNAKQKGISLDVDIPQHEMTMWADARAVKQILFNLVSNAIKFTPELGQVTVTAWQSSVTSTLTVRDTGVGIPKDQLSRITQPFYQVDNRFDAPSEGTGLGLALVRQLVELHGGSLDIESEEGVGTTVRVRFPQSGGSNRERPTAREERVRMRA